MSNSAFTPTVLTIPATTTGGTGEGELNVVTNPAAATDVTGWTAGTITPTRDSSGSPLDPVIPTGLNITNTSPVVALRWTFWTERVLSTLCRQMSAVQLP